MDHNPSINDVLFMHAALVKEYGGASGVRDAGSLDAAVARPWGASFGQEHFPTPFDKAAAICEAIIKRHPFVNGNKRTGSSAGSYLLEALGYRVRVKKGEVAKFALAVANDEMTFEEISDWFGENSEKI
ncbi:MAG: type II toxin-antitoxin system death-on-curing family toxin [Rubrobacteraceae bacterium]